MNDDTEGLDESLKSEADKVDLNSTRYNALTHRMEYFLKKNRITTLEAAVLINIWIFSMESESENFMELVQGIRNKWKEFEEGNEN